MPISIAVLMGVLKGSIRGMVTLRGTVGGGRCCWIDE
jgi:hypothetical protein